MSPEAASQTDTDAMEDEDSESSQYDLLESLDGSTQSIPDPSAQQLQWEMSTSGCHEGRSSHGEVVKQESRSTDIAKDSANIINSPNTTFAIIIPPAAPTGHKVQKRPVGRPRKRAEDAEARDSNNGITENQRTEAENDGCSDGQAGSQNDIQRLELFCCSDFWKEALKAAKEIEKIRSRKVNKRQRLNVKTRTFKQLLALIGDIRRHYERLRIGPETEDDADEDSQRLSSGNIQSLDEQIFDLQERDAGTENVGMIRDIYYHGIPELVFLVEAVLHARTAAYSAANDTNALGEAVKALDIAIQLCKTAKGWQTALPASLPPVKKTAKRVYPNLRHLRNRFEEIRQARIWEAKTARDEGMLKEAYRLREQREEEREKRKWMEIHRRRELGARDAFRIEHPCASSSIIHPPRSTTASSHQPLRWTKDMDNALLNALRMHDDWPSTQLFRSYNGSLLTCFQLTHDTGCA
jgi:hypothetical protein